jgi:hypothetical protein
MAPRNQTKKPKTREERELRADIKEAKQAFKNQKKEEMQKAALENKKAKLQARLDEAKGNAAKAGPANVAQPESAPQPEDQVNPPSDSQVIVIND